MMSEEFEVERTLCQLPSVHVIRIPTRKTAEGHRAADWPQEPIWSGKLKITAKGRVATVTLLNEKNEIFGQCPVTDDAAVERTLDSGRYFVLRIQNAQGKHAFIGIAFNERNDAFEFNVSLQEFRTEVLRESQPVVAAASNFKDLSLKDGEKIKISISRKKKEDAPDTKSKSNDSVSKLVKVGGGLLAPPPKGGLQAPPKSKPNISTSSSNNGTGSNPNWYSSTTVGSSDINNDPFACNSHDPFGNRCVLIAYCSVVQGCFYLFAFCL